MYKSWNRIMTTTKTYTWGNETNANLQLIQQLSGYLSLSIAGGAGHKL